MARRRSAPPRATDDRRLELVVERLSHGPESIARSPEGKIVFLDGGLPGERVVARVQQDRRDFIRASVVAREEDAAERRAAPCPVVAECGGCPWQHIDYTAQLEHKEQVVLRELWRGARMEPQTVLDGWAGDEWRTRHRIRLAIERRREGRPPHVGFRVRGTRRVVAIDGCHVAAPALTRALPLAWVVAEQRIPAREVELAIDDADALFVRVRTDAPQPLEAEALWKAVNRHAAGLDLGGARLAGLAVEGGGRERTWARTAGEPDLRIEPIPGRGLAIPIGVFTQVNLAGNRALVEAVLRACDGRERALDLFCGAGNFALPLAAAGLAVQGWEADPRAVAAAHRGARAWGVADRAEFGQADLSNGAPAGMTGADVAVLDPPRSGAAAIVAELATRRPPRVVYVSCDVATFARDLRVLGGAGYRLDSLQLVDLTPQTHRAEVVGVLGLT